ncbi:hypothetical protein BDF19DRAFT_464159 [Syncephalis fuscata]|nr:hypothetical protein BDF19DRAFT_464159 [Syncephalis fuscata]
MQFDPHRSNSTDHHLSRQVLLFISLANGGDIRGIPKKDGAGKHNWGSLENTTERMEGISASAAQRVASNTGPPLTGSSLSSTTKEASHSTARTGGNAKQKEMDTRPGTNRDTKIQILDEEAFEQLRQAMKS